MKRSSENQIDNVAIQIKLAWRNLGSRTQFAVTAAVSMIVICGSVLVLLVIRSFGLLVLEGADFWREFFPFVLIVFMGVLSMLLNFLNGSVDEHMSAWFVRWLGELSHELVGATVVGVIFVLMK